MQVVILCGGQGTRIRHVGEGQNGFALYAVDMR